MDLSWLMNDLMTQSRLLITAGTAVTVAAMSAHYKGAMAKMNKKIADTQAAVENSPTADLKEKAASDSWAHRQEKTLEERRRNKQQSEIDKLVTESISAENFAKEGAGKADSFSLPPLKDVLDELESGLKEEKKNKNKNRKSTPRSGGRQQKEQTKRKKNGL